MKDTMKIKVDIEKKTFGKPSLRFTTINLDSPLEIEQIALPFTPSGKYIVDDSCFVPMSEAIKQLGQINDPTNGQLAEVYDFPNGKDNGKQIPLSRLKDIKDIAEISQEISDEVKDMTEKAYEIKNEIKRQSDFENSVKELSKGSISE